MEVLIRRATRADLDAAASVLADAFADYPWTRWTVEATDHRRRIEALQRLSLEVFGLGFGEVWLAQVGGAVVSVAAWNDSDAVDPSAVPSDFASTVRALEGDRHDASIAASGLVDPLRPEGRQLFLGVVGTAPDWQRRGIAVRTLEPLLTASAQQGLPIVLETSSRSNVGFYEGLGFVTRAHATVPDGGPDVWVMERSVIVDDQNGATSAPG